MVLPENIDFARLDKYILTIHLSEEGCTFSLFDSEAKDFCLRKISFADDLSTLENIQKVIFDYNFLTQQYKYTNVITTSPSYDITPSVYFDEKEKDVIYKFVHTGDKESIILSTNPNLSDYVTTYTINKDVYDFLIRSLYNPVFHHHAHILSGYLADKGSISNSSLKMVINFHNNLLDVFIYAQSRLTHAITYKNEVAENQTYFILKLWETCRLDQEESYLYSIGGTSNELVISLLQKYISNIEHITIPSDAYLWSGDVNEAPLEMVALLI